MHDHNHKLKYDLTILFLLLNEKILCMHCPKVCLSLNNLVSILRLIFYKVCLYKLGELGEILTGSTPSTSNSAYYSEDGAKVGRIVPANTILCTCIASIGKNTLLTVKGSFNQQINSLTPNAGNDAYFLLTESELWSNKMKRMAASGTMQIVNKTEFSNLDTLVPSTDEQKRIGSYFRNLDNLITLMKGDKVVEVFKI